MIKIFQVDSVIFIWLLDVGIEFVITSHLKYRRGNKRIHISRYTLSQFNIGYNKISDQYGRNYINLRHPYSDFPGRIDFK